MNKIKNIMKRKIFKITESDLHNIVKNSINEILKNNVCEDNFDVNSINISDIDIEILKQAYVDLRLVPTMTVFGDCLSNVPRINEAFGEIMSPDSIVNNIIKKYYLHPSLIIKKEAFNQIYVYVITACIGINDKIIENDMQKMGYFLGCRGDVQNIGGMLFQVLQFEPYCQMQNDETVNVKSQYRYLFHWTPKYYINDILQNGLIPNHKNKLFSYPSRIYLMKGDSDLFQMKELGQQLCLVNTDSRNNGEYYLLKINLENIDNNIHFYYDSNTEIGIYTEQSIPPNHINTIGKFTFKTHG